MDTLGYVELFHLRIAPTWEGHVDADRVGAIAIVVARAAICRDCNVNLVSPFATLVRHEANGLKAASDLFVTFMPRASRGTECDSSVQVDGGEAYGVCHFFCHQSRMECRQIDIR